MTGIFIGKISSQVRRCCFMTLNYTSFSGKLRSRWTGPFVISHIFSHGAIKIQEPMRGTHFKVNGQRLKPFLELPADEREVECLMLYKPQYRD